MGKRIIIKGADFSANAIEQVLPTHYDYALKAFLESSGMAGDSNPQDGDYFLFAADGTLRQYNSGIYTTIPYSDGTIFKVTDNLYVIFSDSKFNVVTENDTDITPSLVEDRIFSYTAPNTVTQSTSAGWESATVNVKAGDIICVKGTGGGGARLLMVSNTNAMEHVSSAGVTTNYLYAYEVQADGVMYVNMNSAGANNFLKVLR